jgi:hypothetical protein
MTKAKQHYQRACVPISGNKYFEIGRMLASPVPRRPSPGLPTLPPVLVPARLGAREDSFTGFLSLVSTLSSTTSHHQTADESATDGNASPANAWTMWKGWSIHQRLLAGVFIVQSFMFGIYYAILPSILPDPGLSARLANEPEFLAYRVLICVSMAWGFHFAWRLVGSA